MTAINSADHLQQLPHSVVSFEKIYENGYVSKKHNHPRHQLIYSVTGLMMVSAGDMKWTVPSGFGLLVPAMMDHETKMIGDVGIQTLYFARLDRDADLFARCRVVGISKFLSTLIAELCCEEREDRESRRAEHLRELILIELTNATPSPLALRFPSDPQLRRVCDALAADPSKTWDINQWAYETGKSRRSFTRSFHAETGLTFREWSQCLRCQLALTLIAQGRPIAKVAYELGYGSKYTLRKMMKKLLEQ